MQLYSDIVMPGAFMPPSDISLAQSRRQLRAIYEAINSFRDLSHTMPVGEVAMFLLVALNEGGSLTDLAETADMKKSTASRYLLDLSDKTRAGGPGYGLINRETDPDELRRNMYSLSPKGRKLIQQLTQAIEGA